MNDINIKGWCPGALRPMESGDGFIVRIHPHLARLSPTQLLTIADSADRFGNGQLDLTRRGNLQIRGITSAHLTPLQAALDAINLLDKSAEAETRRNILVSPLSGIDPTCRNIDDLASVLATALEQADDIGMLPAKFSNLIDGGGILRLTSEKSDLRFVATGASPTAPYAIFIGSDLQPLGLCDASDVVEISLRLTRYFVRTRKDEERRIHQLLHRQTRAAFTAQLRGLLRNDNAQEHNIARGHTSIGCSSVNEDKIWFGLGLPFGAASTAELRVIGELALRFSASIRLTPWRTMILSNLPLSANMEVAKAAEAAGFITEPSDIRSKLSACSGSPACSAAEAATRSVALEIAEKNKSLFSNDTTLHVSGCAKGCARSVPADIMLTGANGLYHLGFNTTADKASHAPLPLSAIHTALAARGIPSSKEPKAMHDRKTYIKDGAAIYARSFAIIRSEAQLDRFTPDEEKVAVRIIHACGMVEVADAIRFSHDLIASARAALNAGAPILCDSKMVANGVTRTRLPANNEVICTLDHPDVLALAEKIGNTRSAAAMEIWGERLQGAVVAVGNAPTSLFHLLDMLDRGAPRPAAVLGFPVGFVGAAESKDALARDGRLPFVIVEGRRGGSAMAAAAINALASEKE